MEKITARTTREFVSSRDDLDVARFHYCYEIGSTFTILSLMEDNIATTMMSCDRIKLKSKLGEGVEKWQILLERRAVVQESTLGQLVRILSDSGIVVSDLNYLKWVRDKRNFFIHRYFHRGNWPGDISQHAVSVLCRELIYLQHIFMRASSRIARIFGDAGLMVYQDLGENGALLFNHDLFEIFESDADQAPVGDATS